MVWHDSMTYNYPQLIVETQAPDQDNQNGEGNKDLRDRQWRICH